MFSTYLIGIPRQWFLGLSQTISISIFDKTVISKSRSVQVTVDIQSVDSSKNSVNIFQAKIVIGGPAYRGLIRFKVLKRQPLYMKYLNKIKFFVYF